MQIAAYVLDINGKPLMPMSNYKRVRKLLKENETIQKYISSQG